MLEPIVSSPQRGRRSRAGGPSDSASRGYMIAVGAILAVIVVLIVLLATGGSSKNPGGSHSASTAGSKATATAKHKHAQTAPAATRGASEQVTLSLTPTATVYVCLLGDGGRKLIPGVELQPGQTHRHLPRQALRDHARQQRGDLVVDGKPRTVPPSSTAIGYSITKARGRKTLPPGAAADLQVSAALSARAGIVVTGTEVLSGRVSDRNGPWLAERLRGLGVDLAHIAIVGDRPRGHARGARVHGRAGARPDRHQRRARTDRGRPDGRGRRAASRGARWCSTRRSRSGSRRSCAPLLKRWPEHRPRGDRAGNRKQATIPAGATVLEPVGTAPGLVVTPADGSGPDGRRAAGAAARAAADVAAAVETSAGCAPCWSGRGDYRQRTLRLFGIPESEIAETLRVAERDGVELIALEVTTCLKRGEVEVVTRYEPDGEGAYRRLRARSCASATPTRCSPRTAARSTSMSPALLRGEAGAGGHPAQRSPRPSPARAGCWRRG